MPESSADVIRRYLEDVMAAEKSFETQLSTFARDGDDDEVKTLFDRHAMETRTQYDRLSARLDQLGGPTLTAKSFLAHLFGLMPKSAQIGQESDERTVQNLLMAFAIESSECAMYESLTVVASAAGDDATETLAREIQAEEKDTADKIWHFLPSRSKIAFNMLTVNEVDPAVETRTDADRIITT